MSNKADKINPVVTKIAVQVERATLDLCAALTGYAVKAIRRKIESGVWASGIHYVKAPDGRVIINMAGIYRWIDGE